MGVYRHFPYSNFHEMNMDEIIKIVKNMLEEWAQYHAEWDAWMTKINDDWSNYQEVMNEAWQNMQDFINNYFDNLDVQNEINNKITSMVKSGEFANIVAPYIPPQVTAWLAEHITQPVGVVIDTSLSVSGACADAKATGDAITELKDAATSGFIENRFPVWLEWTTGDLDPDTGEPLPQSTNYCYSQFINLNDHNLEKITNEFSSNNYIWVYYYTDNEEYIERTQFYGTSASDVVFYHDTGKIRVEVGKAYKDLITVWQYTAFTEKTEYEAELNKWWFYEKTAVMSRSGNVSIEASGNTLTITLNPSDSELFIFEPTANQPFKRLVPTTRSFTLSNLDSLVINRSTNDVEVVNQATIMANMGKYILLIWNHYGNPKGQWSVYNSNNEMLQWWFYEKTAVMSDSGNVVITPSGTSMIITLDPNDSELFVFEPIGSQPFRRLIPTTRTFTLSNLDSLVINRDTWDLEVANQASVMANMAKYTLLVWNHYGYPKGQWSKYYELETVGNVLPQSSTIFMSRQGEFSGIHENTLTGIKYAKTHGYNYIRVSVCFTSDGVGILAHYNELSRITGVAKIDGTEIGTETISSMTASQLDSNYTFFGNSFTRLNDALMLCKQINLNVTLELKSDVNSSIANTYTDLILALGMNDFVTWADHDTTNLATLTTAYGGINLAYIARISQNAINIASALTNTGKKRIDCYYDDEYDATLWSNARRNDLKIKIGSVSTIAGALTWLGYCDILECAKIEYPSNKLTEALN